MSIRWCGMPRRSGCRHLVGADVEAAIDGRRIAVDDFAAVALREGEGEGALAGRRRAEHGDHDRLRHERVGLQRVTSTPRRARRHRSPGYFGCSQHGCSKSRARISVHDEHASTITSPICCESRHRTVKRSAARREPRTDAPSAAASSRRFVVEERDREERLLGRVLRRQRLRRDWTRRARRRRRS